MKKILHLFTTGILLLISINNLKAQDVSTDIFHDGDVNVLFNIDFNNPTNFLNWSGTNYGDWEGVEWNDDLPKRVVSLSLIDKNLEKFSVANLEKLVSLSCKGSLSYYTNEIWYLDISNCTSLTHLDVSGNKLENFTFSNCKALESVNLSTNNLTALNFVEHPKLTELNCSNNSIEDLNITNCPKLSTLDYTKNKLTSLKTSNCKSLTKLEASGTLLENLETDNCISLKEIYFPNNLIGTLDITGCTELTTLNITNNKLTSLNFKYCSKLDTILLKNNLITNIDISDCPLVSQLDLYNNNLTSLNVADLSSLTDLKVSKNQITNLDVSGCVSLSKLDCFSNKLTSLNASNLTSLSYLDCSKNQLTELTTSGCSKLKTVDCKNNKLSTIDISQSTSLTTIDCSYNNFTNLDLSVSNSIEEVDCSHNNLTTLNVNGVSTLNSLKCSFNNIASISVSGMESLATFYCDNNKISNLNTSGCLALSNLRFAENPIDSINISGCELITHLSITDFNIVDLNISGCTTLSSLSLNREIIESLNAKDCSSIKSTPFYGSRSSTEYYEFPNLTFLDFSGCSSLQSMKFKAPKLSTLNIFDCSSLITFDCLSTKMTDLDLKGCASLENLKVRFTDITSINLSDCKALITLECTYNKITSLDLSNCNKLTELRCGSNEITSLNVHGCESLTKMYCTGLRSCEIDASNLTKLTAIWMNDGSATSLNTSGCISLEEIRCNNNKLTSLDASDCSALVSIDSDDNELTVMSLTGCSALEILSFSNNKLSDTDFSDCIELRSLNCKTNFLGSLETVPTDKLTSVNCQYNKIPLSKLEFILPIKGTSYYLPQNKIFEERHITPGTEIDFSSEETIAETPTNFLWYKNNTLITGVTTAKYTPVENGIYYCRMSNSELAYSTPVKTLDILVAGENQNPTDILLSNNSLEENSTMSIGTISTIDPDEADIYTYTIADNPHFYIKESELYSNKSFNYETDEINQNVTITVTDFRGLSYSKEFTIKIVDVKEKPIIEFPTESYFQENLPVGSVIGTFEVTDEDVDDEVTYSLIDNSESGFELIGDELVSTRLFNYETTVRRNTVKVKAIDKAGLLTIEYFYVNITDSNENPTDITLTKYTVMENTTIGGSFGSYLKVVDPDYNNKHTFTLSDNRFILQEGSSYLLVNSELDYEVEKEHIITVTVTDEGGLSFSKDITLQVTDVNEAPVDIVLSADKIAENSLIETEIGVLTAIDLDLNDNCTLSLIDNPDFKLIADKLISNTIFDYETQNLYKVILIATDNSGLKLEKELTINVTNQNEAPTDLTISNSTIVENSDIGTVVGILSNNDVDQNDEFTYTITDNANFRIEGDELRTKSTFDFETDALTYSVNITATDKAGLKVEKELAITVTNVNEAPTALSLSANSIAENATIGAEVGTLSANEVDANDILTYAIADNDYFRLEGDKLVTKLALDFETNPSSIVVVSATDNDGLKVEKEFTINITDVNEAPGNIKLSANTIAENAIIGSEVGIISATDDEKDAITYSIAGNDTFEVVGDKLLIKSPLDLETTPAYVINITATDAFEAASTVELTITVLNVNEAPTALTLSNSEIEETAPVGTVVGALTAVDVDKDDVLTYSIIENNCFKLEADKLLTKSALDYETQKSFVILMIATDAEGLKVEKEFFISISNVNEAPTDIELNTTNQLFEDASIGTLVGTFKSTDVDENDTQSYTIEANDKFEIKGDELITKSTFDYETKNVYTVNITVSDAAGLSFDKAFNISIVDVNEAPTVIELSSATVEENTEAGFEIGTLSSNEKDANDLISFTILSNDNFKVEGDQLITTSVFNYEERSSYTVSITATDKAGLSVTKELVIEVSDKNEAPEFSSEPSTSILLTLEYIYEVECFDIDGDDLTVEAIELPSWLSLSNKGDGKYVLRGTPMHIGDYNVVLSLTDGEYMIKQEFKIVTDYILGVEEITTEEIVNIYPNPVANELHIDLSGINSDKITISLLSLTGNQIFKETHQNNMSSLKIQKSVQNLKAGMYMLLIESDQNKKAYKIIKR